MIKNKYYVEFLIGRNGQFDEIVSGAINKSKKEIRDDNSSHVLVLPYLTAEYKNNVEYFEDFYDIIEICEVSSCEHFKKSIRIRNQEMVDRSDLVVFYLNKKVGGAYKTYKYALEQDKKILVLNID